MASAVNVCKSCFISKSLNESLELKILKKEFILNQLANANFGKKTRHRRLGHSLGEKINKSSSKKFGVFFGLAASAFLVWMQGPLCVPGSMC